MSRFRRRFWDPTGTRYGLPTYPWRLAPDGMATRRQLRAEGLRPGGQDVAAQVMWQTRRGVRVAYLYRVDAARPVRPMTEGKHRALAAAMRARRTCPVCGTDAGYVLPRHLGTCVPCGGRSAVAA
ncbi:RRQRL motif-containing zinc-binding protein [Yinghuangia sp. YIM S10712]|uniref:RRQRL motif-containing zinc-binding protein n=1 Tax=Yinghuangia sp. YIM S10712 TaxID=3436930 RepID=UPI003F52C2EB